MYIDMRYRRASVYVYTEWSEYTYGTGVSIFEVRGDIFKSLGFLFCSGLQVVGPQGWPGGSLMS